MSFLTRTSLANRLLAGLVTLGVAVFGLVAMTSLKQELMPPMQMPMAFVSVQSQGVAPEEMVDTVTEPTEQALQAVPGVTRVTSTTATGSAEIVVEWPFENDADETLSAIRQASETLKPTFPEGTQVEVFSGNTDDQPAMMLSAGDVNGADEEEAADAADADAAAETAEEETAEEETAEEGAEDRSGSFGDSLEQTVVPALNAVPGVQQVTLAGQEEQRVAIELRPADVAKLGVDPSTIPLALEAAGAALPAGQALSEEGPVSVTVGAALGSVEEVSALPIAAEDGVVRIADFADVRLESVAADSVSRVNGKPSITLSIIPASGANVIDISHGVQAELDRLAPKLDAEFVTIFDQAPYIEQSIHDLSVEGGLGLLFAVLVILAFLWSWRSTLIAAVSIPLSLLITMVGLWWSGNTLNILTLGALTIAIGRVVDDSIVVIENISRRKGDGPVTVEGAIASVRQVAGAITASTLTTVAVFLPIAFVSGIAGQLFRPFAITVSIALLASLLVALTIVPVLAFWFMRGRDRRARAGGTAPDAAPAVDPHSDLAEIHTPEDRLQRTLMPALNATRRHPVITLITSGVLLVATLFMSSMLQTGFLGSSGVETIELTQTPEQTGDADELVAAAEPVEQELAGVSGISDVVTSIPLSAQVAGEPTAISYSLQLTDDAELEAVEDEVQRRVDEMQNADEFQLMTMDSLSTGGSGGIALQIRGGEPQALQEASDLLEERLSDETGVRTVESDVSGDQPVMRVTLDEAQATKLGLDRATVSRAVQEALEGSPIGQLMLDGRERSIVLSTPGSERSAAELGEILLPVTPQQNAEAQKRAGDELQDRLDAEAESARIDAANELSQQLNEAAVQRSDLVSQLGALQSQLEALSAAPIVPGPERTPGEEAQIRAQEERAAQLSALQEAIAGAQGGIEGLDEQMSMLRQSQADAADQLAQQQQTEADQEAASSAKASPLQLSQVAEITEERTAPMITRADGERQVTLTVTPESGALDQADAAVQKAIDETELPAGVSFEVGGVSADQDEAFTQLWAAMLAAIALVLIVMVATFRGFRQPLVLLISIPFAATGAILGLLLTDTPLELPALIGLLMLIGIVVTNAIVLMDLVNRLRAAGASLDEAVLHGTRLRLRPILMTAAATIFALVPMALGLTGGGVFISKPLAIVVIGGLVSSTLLTLILVPILYTLVERRRERGLVRRTRRRAKRIIRRRRRREFREDRRAEQQALREAR